MKILNLLTLFTFSLFLNACNEAKETTLLPTRGTINSASKTPDFSKIPAGKERKIAFISFLTPLARHENQYILAVRKTLLELLSKQDKNLPTTKKEERWLVKTCNEFRFLKDCSTPIKDWDMSSVARRVDIVPTSLTIAQAAIESGWGSSRFARKANNYFGQWCYTSGCGIVPKNRNKNAKHEIKQFSSPAAAVASYMRNINTHRAYSMIREIRENLRKTNTPISGNALAPGLVKYSEEREKYVNKVKRMIANNNLAELDNPITVSATK